MKKKSSFQAYVEKRLGKEKVAEIEKEAELEVQALKLKATVFHNGGGNLPTTVS